MSSTLPPLPSCEERAVQLFGLDLASLHSWERLSSGTVYYSVGGLLLQ